METSAALAWRVFLVGVLTLAASPALADGESLHELIDRHLKPVAGIEPASCTDAEFLRRVSLDLIGMPPTADEARAFLADSAADKRERLIDRLLDSPHFTRHLASTLDLMLMERRANTHVSADEWQAWLLRSVRENKPLNLLAREILLADGEDPATRPAARFALDRGSEPNLLARDIGRVFFGRDLQCAQCHDHPLVDGYLQSDYQGLLAFVAPGYALPRKEGDKQFTIHAERAGTDLAFESVFAKGTPHRTGPRLPDDVTLDEPFYLPGDEYQVAPADNVKSIPKFSRRAKLAELATNGSNRAFNENIANRLWAQMLGRGLVHAVDLHHADNPATDPELLRVLGERLAAMNFDVRGFLREIALSQVYQRAFDLPPAVAAGSIEAAGEVTRLEEQRAAAEQTAKASAELFEQALAAWHQAEAAMLPAVGELDAARNQYAEARKKSDEAAKAVSDATAMLQAKQSLAMQLEQAAAAAKQASGLLAADQELAAAAGQLAARAQQAATEVAALTTMVQEKTAAAEPLAGVKTTVDAAMAKASPAIAATRQAEQAMLAARRQADADASRGMATLRRLATARRVAQLALSRTAAAATPVDAAATQAATESAAPAEPPIDQAAILAELSDRWASDFTVATLKPLTPEQLCWSVFRVTGVYDRYWQAEVAELDKSSPLTDEQRQDAAVQAARRIEVEQKTFDKLKGNVGTFVAFYGAAAGQPQGDFFSTADQALFAANGGAINGWVAPAGDNVTERMIKQTDLQLAAEELYLGVLTRLPTEDEAAAVVKYLTDRAADKQVAAQELVWGLLNSAEFRFNH